MGRSAGCLAAVTAWLLAAALPSGGMAQNSDLANVEVRTEKMAEGVYMLEGAGGNIGLSVGKDAAFLIDDQFAPLTDKIKAAVAAVTGEPVRFVLNTHWHPDHTGGNENLGETGALIVAHENTRRRMSVDQFSDFFKRTVPASPPDALPVVTFTHAVTFHLNGDEIHAFHVEPAHTDGDAVVHFRNANVVHMGDIFVTGRYPFIDLASGGSVEGMIAAADRVLALIDERTRVIPGHGRASDRAGLEEYRNMLVAVRERVRQGLEQGKTLEELIAARPTAEFDPEHAADPIPAARFVEILYQDLSRP